MHFPDSEQKEVINHSQGVVQELTNELQEERSQSKLYYEELEAYKVCLQINNVFFFVEGEFSDKYLFVASSLLELC